MKMESRTFSKLTALVFLIVVERGAAAVMMGGCSKGNICTETLRAFTEDEIEGVLDKIT